MQLRILNIVSDTEKELVNGCLRNDRKTQKELYDRYKVAMYSLALRIVVNPDAAHDALQDAFIDVFGSIGTFRHQSTLGAWIKTIVLRKSLNKLKNTMQFEPIENVVITEVHASENNFTRDDLDKAIKSLPESARAVFLLVEVEGYKHKEVAEMLGISEGTSKSQLNYSKKLLQKLLYERV